MATPDLLFNLRNLFYLGAYQAAINNSDVPGLDADAAAERDVIVFRSYIALGSYQLVISEIDSSAATSLQAVKLLALYLTGDKLQIADLFCIIFGNEDTYLPHDLDNKFAKDDALLSKKNLHALNVQIFIKMHRSDYAEKQLKIMQQIDEDHTLTQLANAWLDIAVGGSKIREAYLIFQDFAEKYPMTGMVLNGKAVCCMHMGSFEEAETLLLEALNKDAKDPETLANLIVCNLHLGKPSSRFLRYDL
ncbi:Coatomer subunit epsilon-1 [Dichanthelium oligosanthes]|uniref:Coatomer subunit epsilon-1 n=1 Tax=Dichanthelium oligosanthes TaxID=888268 RepID=A0A1E5WIW5_9POAL|nr:Coatomer subunit epsilon-1 [Dichanthelium oligosanthes]